MHPPLDSAKSLDYLIRESQPLENLIKRQAFVWSGGGGGGALFVCCLLPLVETGTALAHTGVRNDKSAERAATVLEPAATCTFPRGQRQTQQLALVKRPRIDLTVCFIASVS